MSFIDIEFDGDFSIKNFTLKKFLSRFIKSHQDGSTEAYANPLGTCYVNERLGKICLNTRFLGEPDLQSFTTEQPDVIQAKVLDGDNYIFFHDWNEGPGKVKIETGHGNDIIEVENVGISSKTKKLSINAGNGDDIIGCDISFDDSSAKKKPDIYVRGGQGRDIFYGVPSRLEVYVKDFDIREDSLSLDGRLKKYDFFQSEFGLAIVSKRGQDGVLYIEGVDSIDQISVVGGGLV